jgi:hypothetical protein
MPIKVPTSFTAGRKVTLFGVTYQPGDAVPNSVVKKVKALSALLGRRILVPNLDPHSRNKMRLKHTGPTDLGGAKLRNKL